MSLKGLDLFCGAGGSSRGAHLAGIEVIAGVDVWNLARATYGDNFPSARFYLDRCEALDPHVMKRQIGGIDILLASPECTSHTCAKGASPRSEKSRSTAFQVVRFAEEFKPRWIVVENVVHMRSWKRFENWLSAIEQLGYFIRVQTLNSADFGVPQTRRRLFVTADSHVRPSVVEPTARNPIPVSNLIEPGNSFRSTLLYRKSRAKPTLNRARRAITALGRFQPFLIVYYGSDGAGGWQRIDRPLRTVTTVDRFGYVQPGDNGHEIRMLQVPELQRAMGFPNEHLFLRGTRRDKIKLLGNGVCPPVMKAVIETLVGKRTL